MRTDDEHNVVRTAGEQVAAARTVVREQTRKLGSFEFALLVVGGV